MLIHYYRVASRVYSSTLAMKATQWFDIEIQGVNGKRVTYIDS